MGVHGLWKLIDSSGKPIPLEALENRILAVDVSIWLYQLVKGFQDNSGHSASSAYLLGLFHRICKLLFYRIKPIFVFDGGVPALKRRTIAARQSSRDKASLLADKLRQNLLENLAKQEALGKALGENITIPKLFQSKEDTLYKLPPLPFNEEPIDADSDPEDERGKFRYKDIHSIDITSEEFLSLPADMRHDILTELKETRKQNSWAKLHLMPEVGDEFSSFQMGRLLKRRAVQVGIEKAEGEMGTRGFTISDLQTILSDQGVELGQRIAADSTTKILYNSKINGITKIKEEPKYVIESDDTFNEPLREIKKEEFIMECDDNISLSGELSETESESKSLTQVEILEIIKQENQSSARESKLELSSSPASSSNVKSDKVTELEVNGSEAVENELGNNEQLGHGTLPQEAVHCSSPCTLPEPRTSTELKYPAPNNSSDKENHVESEKSDFTVELVDFHGLDKSEGFTHTKNKKEISISTEVKGIIKEDKPFESNKDSIEEIKNPSIREQCLNDTNILSSEDSDSDFVEVNETPIIEQEDNVKNQPSEEGTDTKINSDPQSKPLEIVVNAVEKLEDDIFSDIFEKKTTDMSNNLDNAKEKEHIEINNVLSTISTSVLQEEEFEFLDDNIMPSSEHKEVQSPVPQLSVKEIIKMKKDLEHESRYLFKETSREDRIASTITEQIRIDAQELLQLFGVPYIIAPMEAEAQCAYLDITGQSHGTITDDSDIWLFGGNNVYKNFFDQKKFVQQFKSSDIIKCLNLGREEMIMLAILSGSDYTLGLTGVGSVTAFEIVAHYPKKSSNSSPVDRLRQFAKEFNLKTLTTSIARKLKKISLAEGFPNPEVVNAYLDPEVDKSTEAFSWSKPNVTEIRRYARDKFGWDQKKTDKILEPVLENLNKTQTQGTLHRFFEWNFDGTEITKSRRVEKAINLMKTPSLLNTPGPSNSRPPIMGNKKYETANNDLPLRSKTPAQVAREKAAKKFQELKKQGKLKAKSKYK